MKKVGLVISLMLVVMLMAVPAWAGDTTVGVNVGPGTSVNTIWNGVNGNFTLNGQMQNPTANPLPAATINVYNGGGIFGGNANLVNAGDNPYGYLVNSTTSNIKAGFTGGGYAQFDLTRDSSKVSSYGPAGQVVYGGVTSDATGEMAMNINTNYAKLVVGNYGQPTTANGRQFEATGTFLIEHGITDGVNGAGFVNSGTGSSQIRAMSSEAGGALGGSPLAFRFGRGAGCYTAANVVATGTGVFTESAGTSNQLNVWAGPYNNEIAQSIPGNGTPGSANYLLQIGYSGNFTLNNFSIDGK